MPEAVAVLSSQPVVFEKAGTPMTNSRHVAAFVGKRHDHVLRDLDTITSHAPDLGDAWFQEVSEPHPTVKGRKVRVVEMTRDGAVLLISGYTGPKAIDFKIAYIRRFNEMEEELRKRKKRSQARRRALPGPSVSQKELLTERDLYGLLMNAQMRVERREASNTADALYFVLEDRINREAGMRTSGKLLLSLPKDQMPAR